MIAPAGRKLGKYEILRKLGRGGMADVYLGNDTELGHNVALKLIEHAADADTRDSIEAERSGAALQGRLAEIDPRVVRVYGFGDLDGFFFVSMEYIDGQDLAELMRGGPDGTGGRLEVEFATDVAIDVAETLDHAHSFQATIDGKEFHGIIHGDIKPKNIRVDSHGTVRVLDFGIAKALSLSRRLTRNEFGSVPYASPERLDRGEVNAASDLWSLAVMLYEMVTGLQPYQGETTERLERMIRSGIPPPPAPDPCPEPLRRILMKAMAPDPALRYQSASDLGSVLHAFRNGDAPAISTADL
ncbi:MAG TPA: serine/threonine-protein kinase, partial [Bryobacteraceae bacterium]|nr:serine/threonine-protein kinase [Bryobacteraceae bacterium]